jgi:hypothetical protein
MLIFVMVILGFGAGAAFGLEVSVTPKTVIQFATDQEASRALSNRDTFVESLSPFDRAARKQTDKPVNQDEFLSFVSAQALSWTNEETGKLAGLIGSISNKFTPFVLSFPAKVLLVKTTGKEEGDAAYCRNLDVIVLPKSKLADSVDELENTLIHELFHILSRNNPKLRDSLYGIVGFKPCREIEFPESLKPRKITNPDAPKNEHYLEVEFAAKQVQVIPVLFSRRATYEANSGKNFFDYLTFKLLAVERTGAQWTPKILESEPWLLDVSAVKNFHEQIGRNTGYIIHPEELLADNFVFLANQKRDLPSPKILDEMRRLLAKP